MANYYDKDVYDKMKKALKATCKLLKEKSTKEEILIKYKVSRKIEIHDSGYSIEEKLEPSFDRIVFKYDDEIQQLPELDELAIARLNSESFKRPSLSRDDGRLILEEDYLPWFKWEFIQFLFNYLRQNKTISYNNKLFNKMYKEYEYFKVTNKVTYNVYCPLLNFNLKDIDEFVIEDDIKIKKIDIPEIEKIIFDDMIDMFRAPTLRIYNTYVIHTTYESMTGDESNKFHEINNKFLDIITSLRLFKDGNLHYELVRKFPITWASMYSPYIHRHVPPITSYNVYELDKDEIKNFIDFYKIYRNNKNKEQLTIAINRLNYAYERTRNEDKLIDYAIAFDSLFVEKVEPRGKYVGSSCCMLIGNSFSDRNNIKTDIIKGYKIRNNVVHGKKYSKKSLDKNTPIMESYLKKSIKKLLKARARGLGSHL